MKFKVNKGCTLIAVWVVLIALMVISTTLVIIGAIDPRDEETKRVEKLAELMESNRFIACMDTLETIYDNDARSLNGVQSITYVPCYVSSVNSSTGGQVTGNKALITVYVNGYKKYFLYTHNKSSSPYIIGLSDEKLYMYKQHTSGIVTEYNGYELELMISEVTKNGID